MSMFYIATLCAMICLLVGAFLLLLPEARQNSTLWLIAFLGSLILNTAWGFLGPIFYGLQEYDILKVGDLSNRVASFSYHRIGRHSLVRLLAMTSPDSSSMRQEAVDIRGDSELQRDTSIIATFFQAAR
ncbi:MAG: hypothetical protein ACYC4U_27320 [Pirellulaceae bacterium]